MEMDRLQKRPNGNKVNPTFSNIEMDRRQANLRQHMAKYDIDAVILTSYHNINYFADFMYCYFGRKYGFVVTQNSATSVSAGIDGGQPWRRTHGENIIYTDWRKDNYFYAIQELTKGSMRIAIEFDHVSLDFMEQLKTALPDVEFVDIGQATMWMRTLKSDEEILLIKQGARVADIGGAACADAIRAGAAEHEIAMASTQAMIREIAKTYPDGELLDTWTWFQSGINTDGAHNPVTSRKLVSGDILSLNCFPMIAGYYTALERTLFCDFASDAHIRIWEINCEVHRRGLDLIVAGKKCCDVASELNEIYRENNLLQYRSFGYGHSFGTLSHYYGREAGVELREDIDTKLAPGMVVSMEPMLMLPEGVSGAGGYREHDILVISDSGVENITKFPFGPEHNIIKS